MTQPIFGQVPQLAFRGYRPLDAGADDGVRRKWDGVRGSLYVPQTPDMDGLSIADLNIRVNRMIDYAPEPDGIDVWQTPTQTLLIKRGDCEDYAILKYALLQARGIPVRLVVGEIKSAFLINPQHAWCAAFIDGAWCVFDNKFDQIIKADEYQNWIPSAAMHDASVMRFGREFTIAESLGGAI